MNKVKILSKRYIQNNTVYDIEVSNSHHYILDNGVVSHNSQSFIPTQVAGGGCLSPESLVLMSDGKFKEIKDINEGDFVETLNGKKKILKTWKLNKPSYRIKFEDGSELVCSEDHRFYIGNENDDYLDDNNWIYAKDLKENDEVSQTVVK